MSAQPNPRRVLIDHLACGGAGCARCQERGTATVSVKRQGGGMPSDEAAFAWARQHCPCYEGISVNAGVSQCTHADAVEDGEWCDVERCPLVPRP